MLPDRVSNPGPLTYESGALSIALRGPSSGDKIRQQRLAELSFLHLALCIDLFYNPTKYH